MNPLYTNSLQKKNNNAIANFFFFQILNPAILCQYFKKTEIKEIKKIMLLFVRLKIPNYFFLDISTPFSGSKLHLRKLKGEEKQLFFYHENDAVLYLACWLRGRS